MKKGTIVPGRKCSILGFVFQNLSTKKMMSHITSYMVGKGLGKIQGKTESQLFFYPPRNGPVCCQSYFFKRQLVCL